MRSEKGGSVIDGNAEKNSTIESNSASLQPSHVTPSKSRHTGV